jgi:D-alanine-D-alanine ligase-like ATP-grasp enzyme
MFRILQDAEIPTPPELPLESNEMGYYRAKDNHVYLRDFQREGDLYKTAPLDIDREYRVLVFQDNVYATMLKKPKHYTSDFNLKFLGRKLDTCNFIYVKPRPRLLKLCKATMNALGLTFAGIDIALTTDNQMYAIEANSAPGLGEKNLNLFIEQLKNYLERQEL